MTAGVGHAALESWIVRWATSALLLTTPPRALARTWYVTPDGAVHVTGDLTIRDCVIRDNVCRRYSAAVAVVGDVSIAGCTFLNTYTGTCGQLDPHDPGTGGITHSGGTLLITDCTFEGNSGLSSDLIEAGGQVIIRNSVIRGNGPSFVPTLFESYPGSPSFHLEGNLFVDNWGYLYAPTYSFGVVPFDMINNTFARNAILFDVPPEIAPGSIVRGNVFSGSNVGLSLPNNAAGITVECNDSWGNGTNWQGFDPAIGPGNFSEDPRYCDPANDAFTVAANSPLLPPNNSCGIRIGAFGQGCGPISIERTSWGRIKAGYRGSGP